MRIVVLFLIGFTFLSCNDSTDPVNEVKFDRTAFLENYANSYIIPGFQEAANKAEAMHLAIEQLNGSSDLEEVKQLWKDAYLSYINVSQYNIGPAEEEVLTKSLVEEVATFPVNITAVNAKIDSKDFKLNDFQRDTRGFFTMEYILFENFNESSLLYLTEISSDLNSRIAAVNKEWQGDYKSTFVKNDGTSAGSSTSQLYNEFLKSFESLKNFKLGLPLGLRPGQTAAVPRNVEALYSGNSLLFAEQHFNSLKNFWVGSNQKGFKDYLLSVEGGEELVSSTETQILAVENAFSSVSPSDFSSENLDGNISLIDLHTELQKLTRYFKSEMSSLLGIAITFSSGDGD